MAASVPVVAAASIDQRFAQLIQQFGLTKNSFAISLGKTASVVQHLIDGRNKPGFDLMCKVFEVYPNVSRDWLLLGRGPMLIGSHAVSGPELAATKPAAPEPEFEPIDLADVAPRAARRPVASRLQPEEIAATLALATAVADAPVASAAVVSEPSVASEPPITAGPISQPAATPATAEPVASALAAANVQRPVRPFRPTPAPDVPTAPVAFPVAAEPTVAPPVIAPIAAPPAAPVAAAPVAATQPTPASNPDAYVAGAIHAQHLQHQLALAELRNQHLLEQQQMLREMLAMARQSMV